MRKMKDSGIEWIGEVPKNWNLRRGKNLYKIDTGKLDANAEDIDGRYPFFTCSMFPKKINKYAFDCEALLVAGNGIVGFTQYYKGKFNAYQRTYVLSDFKEVNPHFLKYYVSNNLSVEVEPNSVGSVIQFIKLGDLQNFHIALPNNIEQEKIANFLDKKVAQIDDIIEKTKETIEDYKKYRELIITKTVSCGVDSNKDDILKNELFGQINKKYKNTKFKYVGTIKSNLVKIDEYLDFPQVSPDKIEKGTGKLIYYNSVKDSNIISDNHLFFKGMIVYSKIRPLLNKAIIASFDGLCSADMYPIECKINTKYLLYYILSDNFLRQISISNNRVKMPKLNRYELNEIKVIIPDKTEQQKIVDFLDEKCKEIDELIINKEKLITEMEQYKKSLIYEYVTGKKEVSKDVNYSAEDISNWILNKNLENRKNGKETVGITNLKLQKLLYYASGIYFLYKKCNLIKEDFVAWKHGPVIKQIYYKYNSNGAKEIQHNRKSKTEIDNETQEILDKMYSKYSQYTAEELRNMTHKEGPWKKTSRNKIIEKDLIKDYFENEYKWEQ